MKSTIGTRDKQRTALVLLVVWMLTLGASLASACMPEATGTGRPSTDHHGAAAPQPAQVSSWPTGATEPQAPSGHRDAHAGFHLVHCQPLQAPGRAQLFWPPDERSFDVDGIVASVPHGTRPVASGDRPALAQLRADPVLAQLPLFIRFRRMTP